MCQHQVQSSSGFHTTVAPSEMLPHKAMNCHSVTTGYPAVLHRFKRSMIFSRVIWGDKNEVETTVMQELFTRMLWTVNAGWEIDPAHKNNHLWKMKPSPMFLSIPFSSCLPTCVCVWVHMCLLSGALTLLPETLSLNPWLVSNSRPPVQGWKGDFSLPPP